MIVQIASQLNPAANITVYNISPAVLAEIVSKLKTRFYFSTVNKDDTSIAKLMGGGGLTPYTVALSEELYKSCSYQDHNNNEFQGFVSSKFVEIHKVRIGHTGNNFVYKPILIQKSWTSDEETQAVITAAKSTDTMAKAIVSFLGANNFNKSNNVALSPSTAIKQAAKETILEACYNEVVSKYKFLTKFFVHKDNPMFGVIANMKKTQATVASVVQQSKPQPKEVVAQEEQPFLGRPAEVVVKLEKPTRPSKEAMSETEYKVALETYNKAMKLYQQQQTQS
jgi:hypothetical protein